MNEATYKMYRGGQIEALFREIFALQTSAGWQDERDFAAWYARKGWRYGPPHDPGIVPGALFHPVSLAHGLSDTKAAKYRQEMQTGQWSDATDPIVVLADGEVIDGHHRLTAASEVDWETVPNRPLFTVVFRSDVIPD